MTSSSGPDVRPGSGPAGWDGRWLAATVILSFCLVMIMLSGSLGRTKVWRLAGALPLKVQFADLYVFPSARHEVDFGRDPYVSNLTDPLQRVYNYPRLWLLFMRFPAAWIPFLGWALMGTVLSVLFLWWGRLTWWQGLLGGLLVCSPPLVLAFDRGNSDLLVWLLVVGALVMLQRGWTLGSWLALGAAFVLKLYPVAAFAVFLRLGWRRAWPWLVAAVLVTAGYIGWNRDEISAIARNTPAGIEVSYGSSVWTRATSSLAARLTGRKIELSAYVLPSFGAALALGAIGFVAGYRTRHGTATEGNDAELDAFRVGACIYAFTFVISASYVYRHVFLLLCLPWLWWQGADSQRKLQRPRLMALVILGGLLLINPFWWPPLIIGREICAWFLLGIFCWLLGATLPPVVIPTINAKFMFRWAVPGIALLTVITWQVHRTYSADRPPSSGQDAVRVDSALMGKVSLGTHDEHFNAGYLNYRMGRLEEAVVNYREAIRLDPDSEQSHYNLGNALLRLNRLPEAMAAYEQAIRLKPDYADVHYNLAEAYLHTGRFDEALQHAKTLVTLEPDSAEANTLLQRIRQSAMPRPPVK